MPHWREPRSSDHHAFGEIIGFLIAVALFSAVITAVSSLMR